MNLLKVTGLKTDLWLVKTVGIILAVIGFILIVAQVNAGISAPIIILAIGSALSLALVEFIYVAKRVDLSHLPCDAPIELILIGWWFLSLGFS